METIWQSCQCPGWIHDLKWTSLAGVFSFMMSSAATAGSRQKVVQSFTPHWCHLCILLWKNLLLSLESLPSNCHALEICLTRRWTQFCFCVSFFFILCLLILHRVLFCIRQRVISTDHCSSVTLPFYAVLVAGSYNKWMKALRLNGSDFQSSPCDSMYL